MDGVIQVVLAVLGLLTAAAAGSFVFNKLKMRKRNTNTARVTQGGIGKVTNTANITQGAGNDSRDGQRTSSN